MTATVTIVLGDDTAERPRRPVTRLMPFVNDPYETNPNGTGPSWVDIADVNLALKSVVALPGATCAP